MSFLPDGGSLADLFGGPEEAMDEMIPVSPRFKCARACPAPAAHPGPCCPQQHLFENLPMPDSAAQPACKPL